MHGGWLWVLVLVEALQVRSGDKRDDWLAVAGEHDSFAGVDDPVDQLGEFGAGLSDRNLIRHAHTLQSVHSVQWR